MSLHHRMMLQRYGLGTTTSLYSQVVFDPIFTPLFLSLGFTGTITIGTSVITTASIASAIATTALTFGLQMLMAPKPPKPEDGKAPKTQSLPFRSWCVGRNRMAGAYMLWESSGKDLYAVQAIAGHPISEVLGYWLHDDRIELDQIDDTVGPTFGQTMLDDSKRYGNNVFLYHRLGTTIGDPYQPLVDVLGTDGVWTEDHRLDGQASVAMIAHSVDQVEQSKRFPYGVPNLSVEVDGAVCWDFRDEDQDPTDQTTWTYTKNCAVILAWHLCFSEFGEKLDYTKAILPVLSIWQEEADVCDERVALNGGGTEARYECNGWDTTENSPKVAVNAILAACDGHLVVRGDGARILTVGKFRESRCGVLRDADIIGHNIQYDVLFEDEINRLVPKFTYPPIGYATADTDYFEDTDAQLEAGRVLSEDADYGWVQQWRQARRLAKREWLRIQQKVNGSIDVRFSGINSVYNRWNRLQTPYRLPRLNTKIVENRRAIIALTKGGFSMDIKQHPENIDVWIPDEDEGVMPPVPDAPNFEDIITPVINLVQAKPKTGSVYIRVLIEDPEDDSLTPVVRYRIKATDTGNPGAWITQEFNEYSLVAGYVELNTGVVPTDETIQIQVSFKTSKGMGNWTSITEVSSTIDPDSPGPVTGASATGGVGGATFNWTAPGASNYAGAILYWNTTNTITGATRVSPPEYGAPSAADSRLVTGITAGTRYGFIRAINGSGTPSSYVATGAFTVT